MGLMPNVGTGQVIQTTWGNDIRDRTVQRFTNYAQLTGDWPAAGDGSLAYLEDVDQLWGKAAGTWRPVSPPTAHFLFSGEPLTTSAVTIGTVTFPTPTYNYRFHCQLTWRYFHPAVPGGSTVRIPTDVLAGGTNDSTGNVWIANVETYAAWNFQSLDRNAGQAATFPITAFALSAGGGIRYGNARVQVVPR